MIKIMTQLSIVVWYYESVTQYHIIIHYTEYYVSVPISSNREVKIILIIIKLV